MGDWTPAPAAVPNLWRLERHIPDAAPELSMTPDGRVRLFPCRERALSAATWLNAEEEL